jgi:hypothetical protein
MCRLSRKTQRAKQEASKRLSEVIIHPCFTQV